MGLEENVQLIIAKEGLYWPAEQKDGQIVQSAGGGMQLQELSPFGASKLIKLTVSSFFMLTERITPEMTVTAQQAVMKQNNYAHEAKTREMLSPKVITQARAYAVERGATHVMVSETIEVLESGDNTYDCTIYANAQPYVRNTR